MRSDIDLLLLNCSNLPEWPIFPYAFVQVSALARRRGLAVERFDLLGLAPDARRRHLRALIERHRPRMIGFTVRQCDTQIDGDYLGSREMFFPVEDTRDAIGWCRELTDAPIAVGGFGFTAGARPLFDYLGPDLGVQGEPDWLLERFEGVLRREDLAGVPNLLWRDGGAARVNPRDYAPPLPEREYDETILRELIGFYGPRNLFSPDGEQVCVEVMRGCPYRCYFCTEPPVKGTSTRYRDLDVVEAEVEFLARNLIRKLWFVCSELNMGKPDFPRLLAERMIRLNERLPDGPIEWNAYYLPRWLTKEDLALLFRSGFRGGWDDFPSLDDENLKACKVPYRAEDARRHLEQMHELTAQAGIHLRTESTYSVFLGNTFATPRSISTTLRHFDEGKLTDAFEHARVRTGTRVYEACPDTVPADRLAIRTRTRDGGDDRLFHPSFAYPEALLADLGSVDELRRFFSLVVSTFLTHAHRRAKDWCWFLARTTTPEQLRGFLEPALAPEPVPADLLDLFAPAEAVSLHGSIIGSNVLAPPERPREQAAAAALIGRLHAAWRGAGAPARAAVELRPDDFDGARSDYAIHEALYRRFDSNAEIERAFCAAGGFAAGGVALFLLRAQLFQANVQLDPRYRRWLFGEPVSSS
jgi:hypothetical protein